MKKIYLQNLSVKLDELLLVMYHEAGVPYHWQFAAVPPAEQQSFIREAFRALSGKITIHAARLFQDESELFDTFLSPKSAKIKTNFDRSLDVLRMIKSSEIALCLTPHLDDLETLYKCSPPLFNWLAVANLHKPAL